MDLSISGRKMASLALPSVSGAYAVSVVEEVVSSERNSQDSPALSEGAESFKSEDETIRVPYYGEVIYFPDDERYGEASSSTDTASSPDLSDISKSSCSEDSHENIADNMMKMQIEYPGQNQFMSPTSVIKSLMKIYNHPESEDYETTERKDSHIYQHREASDLSRPIEPICSVPCVGIYDGEPYDETTSTEPSTTPEQSDRAQTPTDPNLAALEEYVSHSENKRVAMETNEGEDSDKENDKTTTSADVTATPDQAKTPIDPKFQDIELPPEPTGTCSDDLQAKIALLTKAVETEDLDMNLLIQRNKSFRNPSTYEKLIKGCNIDEYGTNFQPQVFDPLKWDKAFHYDELAQFQEEDMKRKEKKRRKKAKLEMLTGRAKKVTKSNGEAEVSKKRKSRWDALPGPSNSSHEGTNSVSPFASSPRRRKINCDLLDLNIN